MATNPVSDLEAVRPATDTALTIGVFDGVHLGHKHLIEQVREAARKQSLASAVVSFRNHPRTVLNPEVQFPYLCPLSERLSLLRATGADHVVPLTFTKELSQYTARQFAELLVRRLRMRHLIVGPDFALGKGREGTVPVLQAIGKELDYTVSTATAFLHKGAIVSSTGVRKALAEGDVQQATELLGRTYAITGTVVEGDRRGRTIGFPTANIKSDPELAIPGDGVYSTIAIVNGRRLGAATNIGVRPTFGHNARTFETYIMDFSGDLYGKHITIEFVARIRPEMKFPGIEALVAQMKKDVEQSRTLTAGRLRG
jgi:riboflavin kinase/FMN adenylyltransferase